MSGEAPRGMIRSSVKVMSVMRIAPASSQQGSLRADLVAFAIGERAASSGIILNADPALSMAPFPGRAGSSGRPAPSNKTLFPQESVSQSENPDGKNPETEVVGLQDVPKGHREAGSDRICTRRPSVLRRFWEKRRMA